MTMELGLVGLEKRGLNIEGATTRHFSSRPKDWLTDTRLNRHSSRSVANTCVPSAAASPAQADGTHPKAASVVASPATFSAGNSAPGRSAVS
ncbi:hypothetical protein EEB14_41710 [Rhodococcus sp. WS4]|nr:hypothetical protein EEB14_41710 [Rhodococcus sp. WS4]